MSLIERGTEGSTLVTCCHGDSSSEHSADLAVGAMVVVALVLAVIAGCLWIWLRRRAAKNADHRIDSGDA